MTERDSGNRHGRGCGCGCATPLVVLTVGLGLAILNAGASIGISARVPFTDSNVTLAGCVGEKDKALEAMPEYTKGRVGGNQNFINGSQTLTIGPIEGCATFIVGKQEGSPIIDIHLGIK